MGIPGAGRNLVCLRRWCLIFVCIARPAHAEAPMSLAHDPGRDTKARPGRKWPLLLNVREVAFELGLSRRRIYQLIDEGVLQVVKIGKACRVPSAAVRKLAGESEGGE